MLVSMPALLLNSTVRVTGFWYFHPTGLGALLYSSNHGVKEEEHESQKATASE
jgi:hypothetical protein